MQIALMPKDVGDFHMPSIFGPPSDTIAYKPTLYFSLKEEEWQNIVFP